MTYQFTTAKRSPNHHERQRQLRLIAKRCPKFLPFFVLVLTDVTSHDFGIGSATCERGLFFQGLQQLFLRVGQFPVMKDDHLAKIWSPTFQSVTEDRNIARDSNGCRKCKHRCDASSNA